MDDGWKLMIVIGFACIVGTLIGVSSVNNMFENQKEDCLSFSEQGYITKINDKVDFWGRGVGNTCQIMLEDGTYMHLDRYKELRKSKMEAYRKDGVVYSGK